MGKNQRKNKFCKELFTSDSLLRDGQILYCKDDLIKNSGEKMTLKSQFTADLPLIRFGNECGISGVNRINGELDLYIVQRALNKLHINTDIKELVVNL